ncbi:MAG: porin family protein [Bacteroidales bacterium]
MKRTYLVVISILLFSSSYAQLFTIAGQDIGFVYLGPKIGTNFSKISNMDQTGLDVTTRMGYQFGGVAELGLTNMLSFETELVFTSKGMSNDLSATRVNYLSIPLLAKFSFNMLGLSRVYATGGMYNNLRTNAKVVYQDVFGESFDETHHYTVIDWGLSVGAGAAYDIGYGLLCLDLRYDLGIVDVEKVIETEKNRNRSLGIALTFKYDAVDLFLRLRKQKLEPEV